MSWRSCMHLEELVHTLSHRLMPCWCPLNCIKIKVIITYGISVDIDFDFLVHPHSDMLRSIARLGSDSISRRRGCSSACCSADRSTVRASVKQYPRTSTQVRQSNSKPHPVMAQFTSFVLWVSINIHHVWAVETIDDLCVLWSVGYDAATLCIVFPSRGYPQPVVIRWTVILNPALRWEHQRKGDLQSSNKQQELLHPNRTVWNAQIFPNMLLWKFRSNVAIWKNLNHHA